VTSNALTMQLHEQNTHVRTTACDQLAACVNQTSMAVGYCREHVLEAASRQAATAQVPSKKAA
jgi:hypothetical protein